MIVPVNSALDIKFDSGEFRRNNSIGWHFMPYVKYRLLVTPENPSTAVAVTVSMSKGNTLSWVRSGSAVGEKNMLYGGQMETYGLAFETGGMYSVTISSTRPVSAMYIDSLNSGNSKVEMLNSPYNNMNSCTFYVNVIATDDHSRYGVALSSNDTQGSGGVYTVAIQKLY
ncbi:hypothetical protein [Fusibacter sp. 3D3]|uniref:hypothetical protein n=1 Tax=Fusibacter sp. 3D3 TaxID=1048380 RepID=UPI00158674B6|nr:hypothetical protein [Fusibacter sp. 3D3]